MTREEVREWISKQKEVAKEDLEYFVNYFYVLINSKWLEEDHFDEWLKQALEYKIFLYDENDEVYKRLGPDCKGLRDSKKKRIYIRKDLPDPLLEMTIYHEMHHAIQTNPENDEVGINQKSNFGRLIMEAQTQYFAEKIYEEIHEMHFEEREIPSEQLRMLPGGTILSKLHNYEMYDAILTKLSILLGVDKEFFININFQYQDDIGMKKLREKYEERKKKYHFPYKFEEFMFYLDCIYCIDLLAYKENPDKENILNGKKTKEKYQIYEGIGYDIGGNLSLGLQFNYLDDLDRKYFMCLYDYNGPFEEFGRYLFKSSTRALCSQLINLPYPAVEEQDAGQK
ncbi:MAG: hypothetical protein IJI60_03325 [Bacilli bacterium]|nr:hypothetical protein [Bacilli bacterium]